MFFWPDFSNKWEKCRNFFPITVFDKKNHIHIKEDTLYTMKYTFFTYRGTFKVN